jgi:hypothetical protein
VIFCLPAEKLVFEALGAHKAGLTVAAGLDRGLDVADTLDGHAVLVIAVDVLVLKLANLVDEHTELVSDVRHIVVACLAPNGELLLERVSVLRSRTGTSSLRRLPCAPWTPAPCCA